VWCALDPNPLPLSYRHEAEGFSYDGDYQRDGRKPGADVDVCFSGNIAITAIRPVLKTSASVDARNCNRFVADPSLASRRIYLDLVNGVR